MRDRGQRAQFVIFGALALSVILFSMATTVFFAANRVQQFRYSNYKEVAENVRSDYSRLLTYSLKVASWDRAKITSRSQLPTLFNGMSLTTQQSSATYGNLATIETRVKTILAAWSNVTSLGLASFGLSTDLDAPNLVLIFNWNVADSNSTVRKKLSFNLTALGFTGFSSTYTRAIRANLNTTYILLQGASVSTLSIRVLDENANPKPLLGINDFYVYNLNAASNWVTWPLSSITYQGQGDYLLTLTTTATASNKFLVIVADGKDLLTLSYNP